MQPLIQVLGTKNGKPDLKPCFRTIVVILAMPLNIAQFRMGYYWLVGKIRYETWYLVNFVRKVTNNRLGVCPVETNPTATAI